MPAEASLIRVQPDGTSNEVGLKPGDSVIGRGQDCQLRIPAGDVSRRHCSVSLSEDGLSIADNDSRNGTHVNGEQVESRELEPGDVVTVGHFVFVVRIDGDPAEIDAAEKYKVGASAIAPISGVTGGSSGSGGGSGGGASTQQSSSSGGLLQSEGMGSSDPEDSSVFDFDFDLSDDEDEQPPL